MEYGLLRNKAFIHLVSLFEKKDSKTVMYINEFLDSEKGIAFTYRLNDVKKRYERKEENLKKYNFQKLRRKLDLFRN